MALSRFQMKKDGDPKSGRIWYEYTCRSSPDFGPFMKADLTKTRLKVRDIFKSPAHNGFADFYVL